jgi:hypothetical protein
MYGVALSQFSQFSSTQVDFSRFEFSAKDGNRTSHSPLKESMSDLFSRVNQILNHKVSESLGNQVSEPVKTAESSFDPDTIAKNVLGFINNRLQQAKQEGASEEELAALLEEAKTGIDEGINEAKEALEGMGMLTKPLEEGIEQAKEQILKGLESNAVEAKDEVEKTNGAQLIEASHRFRQMEESAFELEVRTQDGDLVQLQFSRQEREQGAFSFSQTGSGMEFSSRYRESSSSQFSLTVEGNLDEEELTAISELAESLQGVSESFFDGNVQAAFEQGMSLGFDTEEIAGFALELSHSEMSVATTKYREVSGLSSEPSAKLTGLGQVSGMMDQLSGMLDQAESLFQDAHQTTGDMLSGFFSHHPKAGDFIERMQKAGEDAPERFAEKLVNRVKHHRHDD